MSCERPSNFLAASTLVNAINNVVTSLDVASAAGFPSDGNFRLTIESEILIVTAVSGTTFTITRGAEGTTAANHNAGSGVFATLTRSSLFNLLSQQHWILPARLDFVNSTSLALTARGGRWALNPLTSEDRDVGTTGSSIQTIDNSGVSASTFYYAYWDIGSNALTLETTAPVTTDGIDHKTGDESTVLVGWVYVDGAGLFVADATRQLVASRHQRRIVSLLAAPDYGVKTADDTWKSFAAADAREIWWIKSSALMPAVLSCQGTLRHLSGGARVLLGIGIGNESSISNPATGWFTAHRVDSSTERVSHSLTQFDAYPTDDATGVVGRAGLFAKGETIGSASQFELCRETTPDPFAPWLAAKVEC